MLKLILLTMLLGSVHTPTLEVDDGKLNTTQTFTVNVSGYRAAAVLLDVTRVAATEVQLQCYNKVTTTGTDHELSFNDGADPSDIQNYAKIIRRDVSGGSAAWVVTIDLTQEPVFWLKCNITSTSGGYSDLVDAYLMLLE